MAARRTLLEAARDWGEDIESICGGRAVCGKCIVKIDKSLFARHGIDQAKASLSPPTKKELLFLSSRGLDKSYRLACYARVRGNVVVYVPETSRRAKHVVRKASISRTVPLKPAIKKYYLEVSPATLKDPRSDVDRLAAGLTGEFSLKNVHVDYAVLRKLPAVFHEASRKVTATVKMDGRVIDVQPGYTIGLYGVAVDIGTTTVAGYLCDLASGEILGTEAALNPQIAYGDDVISRINYAVNEPGGLNKLNFEIVSCIGGLIASLAKKQGIPLDEIAELTVVGNTAMHHLFLKLDPASLARSPFTPVVSSSVKISNLALGLRLNETTDVFTLPVIAGFVGADTVGVIIAEEPHRQDKNVLIVDIGTNGELVLGNRKKLVCASCAMGPAFEGGNIKYGMRAAPGAIENVIIDRRTLDVRFKVVGSGKWNTQPGAMRARGICGSGIIDSLAGMSRAGIIESNGRFSRNPRSDRLITTKEGPAFVIARARESETGKDITIGIDDVRSVQLAKAAMHAGARILMDKLKTDCLDKVVLAGAFGSYIDKKNALAIGLFPGCDLRNLHSVGNAAGEGARLALVNTDKRGEAEEIARKIEYVELTTEPNFQKYFVEALKF